MDELGKLAVTACVDYDPADGAAAVCGLDVPEAILAVNYVNAHGGDGALTLILTGYANKHHIAEEKREVEAAEVQ